MITETPLRPRRSLPLPLTIALVVLIAAFVGVFGALVYVLLKPSTETANGLSISSDDPLAVADYHPSSDAPLIGDHWHALYAVFVGNFRLPHAPTWEGSGIHTHADGIIHIHPFTPLEQGRGAALNKWFDYGGGVLTDVELRSPGSSHTYLTGNSTPSDGRPGEVFVFQSRGECDSLDLSGQWVRVPVAYIPHDGDVIRIMFEPEEVMRENIKNPSSVAATPEPTPTPICTILALPISSREVCSGDGIAGY